MRNNSVKICGVNAMIGVFANTGIINENAISLAVEKALKVCLGSVIL